MFARLSTPWGLASIALKSLSLFSVSVNSRHSNKSKNRMVMGLRRTWQSAYNRLKKERSSNTFSETEK